MAQNQPRNQYSNLDLPFGYTGFDMNFETLYKHYFDQLLYITMRLIIFDGLPDTIDETFLKYTLLLSGKSVFFRLDQDIIDNMQYGEMPLKSGDLVALNGNKSDVPTVYYMQRRVLVTNPCFKKTYDLLPGIDCEIVYCTETDKYKTFGYGGLYALIARTATILADNDISINCAQKNTRLVNVIGADDQQTARSAQMAVDAMYNGQPYVIAQKSLVSDLTGIPMTQKTSTSDIVQLIEMRQYIYAHFYEILGLQTHDNMKKERLITDEINDNEEISALNVEDILVSIRDGINRVNRMFGTNITVSINPIIERAHDNNAMDPADDQTEDAAEDQTEDAAEDQPDQISLDITVNAQDDANVSITAAGTAEGEEVQTDDVPGNNATMARNGADAGG